MKPYAERFYKSAAWRKCRKAYIDSVYGLCERCGHPGKIVHHKIYLTPDNINDPNISLSFDNLEYLCQYCHNPEHPKYAGSGLVRPGLMLDENGNLVKMDGVKEKL